MPKQKPLLGLDFADRNGLDGDEDDDRMNRGNAGNEVREDRRNTLNQLGVEKANSRNPVDIRVTSQLGYVARGDLVFELEHVSLPMNIVPNDHDSHEEKGKDEGEKPSLSELIEDG